MRFRVNGEVLEFDDKKMLVREARELKHHTGMGLAAFSKALQGGDPDAIVAMLYLTFRRNSRAVKWADFDEFDLAALEVVPDEKPTEDEPTEGDGQADPPDVAAEREEVTTTAP
jgi:hypothetical protein